MRISIAILACALTTVGCQATSVKPEAAVAPEAISKSEYSQVTNESIGNLVGKKLDQNGDFISLTDDGTFSGTWKNKPIAGNWEMRDGYWCRVLTVFHDQSALNKEDCQLWEIDGNALRGTRAKGTGDSFVYTVSANTLTKDEVLARVSGNTEEWSKGAGHYAADGTLLGIWDGKDLEGSWAIKENGVMCITVEQWGNEEDCHTYENVEGRVFLVYEGKSTEREIKLGNQLDTF